MIHKFRTPIICQNGHKCFWYWQIEDYGIGSIKHLGVISNRCDCPKQALGEGYVKNGDDQLFIGHVDKQGKDIYEGDIINLVYSLDMGQWTKYGGCILEVKWNDNKAGFYPFTHFNDIESVEVIGNIYENPELTENKR
jgi:hypothetical protein